MSIEYIITDMHVHSGYTKEGNSPTDIVRAAAKKLNSTDLRGAIALTDHLSVNGIQEFMQVCEDEKIVGIPGVEFTVYEKGIRALDPSLPEDLLKSNIALLYSFYHESTFEKFAGYIKKMHEAFSTETLPELVLEIHNSNSNDSRLEELGLLELKNHIKKYMDNPDLFGNEDIWYLDNIIAEKFNISTKSIITAKSDFLCYFPMRYLDKMKILIDRYKEGKSHSSSRLLQLLEEIEIPKEDILFVLPHPFSIDIKWWGKLAYYLRSRSSTKQQNFSHKNPDISKLIEGVETVNAGHPIDINYKTLIRAILPKTKYYFTGLSTNYFGNSDSPDKSFLFAGYSLLEIDDYSTEGIIKAIKNNKVFANGWGFQYERLRKFGKNIGNLSPFITRSLLSEIVGEKFPLRNKLVNKIEKNIKLPSYKHVEYIYNVIQEDGGYASIFDIDNNKYLWYSNEKNTEIRKMKI